MILSILQQTGDLRHQDSRLLAHLKNVRPPEDPEEFYTYYISKLDVYLKKARVDPPEYISLAGADLSNMNLSNVSLELVDLRGANLEAVQLNNTSLRFSNLAGANLRRAQLRRAVLTNCVFQDAEMDKTDLSEVIADNTNFRNARLRSALLTAARLQHADFSEADIENAGFQGAQLAEAKFNKCSASGSDFTEANLEKSVMVSASFVKTKLSKTNLMKANLTDTNLTKATLEQSDLEESTVDNADFSDADLRGAILKGVDLYRAKLSRTKVFYEDLKLATFLSSSLRDNSLVLERIKKVRIFVSYSHGDSWFAQRLEQALKKRSIDVWIDKNEILVGDSLLGRIREGIDSSDFVCALISKNSINSRWVQSELEIALNQQIEDQKVKVLPLILEEGIKLPSFLVGKLYIDFSRKEYFDDGVELIMRRVDRVALSHELPRE